MKKGDLVRGKATGELGIVLVMDVTVVLPLDVNAGNPMFVFMGDGLVMVDPTDGWEVIPFSPAASIPANFSELVEAYEKERAWVEGKVIATG